MNDYEHLAEDCETAIQVTEAAYYNAPDEDIQTLLDEAKDKIVEAKRLAEARS